MTWENVLAKGVKSTKSFRNAQIQNLISDVTIYEPDPDMIFNYLMVSALANATDIIEKKNLKATGGKGCVILRRRLR